MNLGNAQFQPFTMQHYAALFCIAVASVLLSFFAGHRVAVETRNRIALAFAILLACNEMGYFVYKIGRGDELWGALPCHLCEISAFAVIIALASRNWFAYEFAYFFGVGGAIQALATPDLQSGFPSFSFLKFFLSHGGLIVGVLYLTAAFRMRPGSGCVWRMIVAGNAYVVVAALLNLIIGTNFGYLCRKPASSSLLDYLGPWPWYLIWMEVIAIATILVLYLPFAGGGRARNGAAGAGDHHHR